MNLKSKRLTKQEEETLKKIYSIIRGNKCLKS